MSKPLPHSKAAILWMLHTASHRMRRIELLRVVPEEAYEELLNEQEIREYRVGKKVFVALTPRSQEWWRSGQN
jgi:hypothetical protein